MSVVCASDSGAVMPWRRLAHVSRVTRVTRETLLSQGASITSIMRVSAFLRS
jgi:hypothetical protein